MKLKDIAARAGVSISTVSRVLNNTHTTAASPEKQELIWKIAQEGGYTPNVLAQNLRKDSQPGKAKVIYCMIATLPAEYNGDPFYTTLMSVIRMEALQHGYIVEFTFSMPDARIADTPLFQGGIICGLIIIGRFHRSVLSELKHHFKNIVYVGLNILDVRCDQIVSDSNNAAQEVIRYLFDHHHRSIGFIGANDDTRLDGYKQGLKSCGVHYQANWVADHIILSIDGGYNGMLSILHKTKEGERVTAVLCANDNTAIGALHACMENGIRVPEDMTIIGINDSEMVRYMSPRLTTVHVPVEEMGAMAIKILIDRIHGGHQQPIKVVFPYWILQRESGPLPIDG